MGNDKTNYFCNFCCFYHTLYQLHAPSNWIKILNQSSFTLYDEYFFSHTNFLIFLREGITIKRSLIWVLVITIICAFSKLFHSNTQFLNSWILFVFTLAFSAKSLRIKARFRILQSFALWESMLQYSCCVKLASLFYGFGQVKKSNTGESVRCWQWRCQKWASHYRDGSCDTTE